MEKMVLSERENDFFEKRLGFTISAYIAIDFIESMYLTYKQEDSKSTSSTECEKGTVKSIGKIQYGC